MIVLRESAVNATERHCIGEADLPVEQSIFEGVPTAGELYRFGLREHGRCMGKVYVDPAKGGPPLHVGYVFEQRQRYEDSAERYLHETWLTVAGIVPASTYPVALIGTSR